MMNPIQTLSVLAVLAATLAGCSVLPPAPPVAQPAPSLPKPMPAPAPGVVAPVAPPVGVPSLVSHARTAADYRLDAAQHIYKGHAARVFRGQLPPLLQAVGVLQIEVNAQGMVSELTWLRPPNHVPEVMAAIEAKVRQAQPYPAPIHLGSVNYIDTWLWDKSGQFQLHTLSEGQAISSTSGPLKPSTRPLASAR